MRSFIVALLFVAAACTPSKNGGEWKTAAKPDFTIQYPERWELNETGQMNTAVVLFAPLETGSKFRVNVNVLVQELPEEGITLDQYTELSLDQLKKALKNSTILENERVSSGSAEYQKLKYQGDVGAGTMVFRQHYFIKAKKAYVLTFTSNEDQVKSYEATGTKILESFKLL